jgi:hypothetical protein
MTCADHLARVTLDEPAPDCVLPTAARRGVQILLQAFPKLTSDGRIAYEVALIYLRPKNFKVSDSGANHVNRPGPGSGVRTRKAATCRSFRNQGVQGQPRIIADF